MKFNNIGTCSIHGSLNFKVTFFMLLCPFVPEELFVFGKVSNCTRDNVQAFKKNSSLVGSFDTELE